jgi:hypothetical protein
MRRKSISVESILVLDNMDSQLYRWLMARLKDIIAGLSHQTNLDTEQVNALLHERESLRPAYLRFQELSEQLEPKQERLSISVSLLLSSPIKVKAGAKWIEDDDEAAQESARESIPIPIRAEQMDLSSIPLWKIIREIVRHGSQMRIVNLQNTLKAFGINVRRQTIESSLAVHKSEFKTTLRGREKYVSLK